LDSWHFRLLIVKFSDDQWQQQTVLKVKRLGDGTKLLGISFMLLVNLFRLQVTYGSVLKLQHERTKFRLHSHEVPYGSGSGQQSVTGFPGVEDANSYWVSILNLKDVP